MLIQSTPLKIQQMIELKKTCIVNLVASWCSDCTKQAKNLDEFTEKIFTTNIQVYQINVQDQRNDFLSIEHQALTEQFGGHGFPRTVLIKNGVVVDADNVEIISQQQLLQLAVKFNQQL